MTKQLLALMVLAGFLAGCNTVEGVKEDAKAASERIKSAVSKDKDAKKEEEKK